MAVAALAVIVDQLSKQWALSHLQDGNAISLIGRTLELRLVHNASSAFGLLPIKTVFISVASLVILAVATAWVLRDPSDPMLMGLIVGGGMGNIVDRMIRPPSFMSGRVVDFIDLSFWPTFNLADSAIVIGVGLLLLRSSGRRGHSESQPTKD